MNANIEQLRRVRSVEVTNLFGLYNHKISLNDENRITIIHGPNGVGKTMLLRMLFTLFGGNYTHLMRIPFLTLKVNLDRGYSVTIVRKETVERKVNEASDTEKRIEISAILEEDGELSEFELGSTDRSIDKIISSHLPFFHRIDNDLWEDERDGEIVSQEELEQRYLPRIARGRLSRTKEPVALQKFRSSVRTHLIETQRLFIEEKDARRARRYYPSRRMIPTVKRYSSELQQGIDDALATYAGESQALDQTFPRRLVELRERLSPEELRAKLDELEIVRKDLSGMGLLVASQSQTYPVSPEELDRLDEATRGVMTLYVQDTAEKLGMLKEIADKIRLLLESINNKFRNKKISVNRKSGLLVSGIDNAEISVSDLSSGEQQEIVILYDLLFRIKPNTLVLIDEPELSLHVTWQKRFLPELLSIAQQARFDAIVATHSPFIIGDNVDLMVALDAEADVETEKGWVDG